MKSFNSQVQIQYESDILFVYFCLLNRNTNHFTLFEINKQERRIYHYDLMTDKDIIDDKMKLIQMRKIIQVSLEFHDQEINMIDVTLERV